MVTDKKLLKYKFVKQSWIFKSMSVTTATARAANKTWILKKNDSGKLVTLETTRCGK